MNLLPSVIGVCVVGAAACGQVFNAAAEFSPTVNGGGVWSYGLAPSGAGSFEAFTFTQVVDNIDFWARPLPFPDSYPKVGHNGTSQTQLWGGPNSPVAAGELVMHPGPLPAVLRFTAPAVGTYRVLVTARRSSGDCAPGGSNGAELLAGSTLVTSGTMTGFASQFVRQEHIYRQAGGTIDLVMLAGGDGINCDHVAAEMVITRVVCGPADVGSTGGEAAPDGVLDNNDFVVFIDWFFAGDTRADIGSTGGEPGSDGVFDNNDFIVFIDRFFAGC